MLDISMNGNSSEAVRRHFPVIVLLLTPRRSGSYPLLAVNSERRTTRLQVHVDVMLLLIIWQNDSIFIARYYTRNEKQII